MSSFRMRALCPKILIRWSLAILLLLLFILTPFLLWNEPLKVWSEDALETNWPPWVIGGFLAGLLAVDLVLPVPSSFLSTAAGSLLGFWSGTLSIWVGMTVGCWIGYGLGAGPGKKATQQLVGKKEVARISGIHGRIGDWVVVTLRAVPVLAEASVIFAGVVGMPRKRFFLMTGLANAGIAAIYAAIGVFALAAESFLPALVGAIILPGLIMFGLKFRP
jgi:uncharacterized membrane protein YdjX (TVP38/TMEM64 family)